MGGLIDIAEREAARLIDNNPELSAKLKPAFEREHRAPTVQEVLNTLNCRIYDPSMPRKFVHVANVLLSNVQYRILYGEQIVDEAAHYVDNINKSVYITLPSLPIIAIEDVILDINSLKIIKNNEHFANISRAYGTNISCAQEIFSQTNIGYCLPITVPISIKQQINDLADRIRSTQRIVEYVPTQRAQWNSDANSSLFVHIADLDTIYGKYSILYTIDTSTDYDSTALSEQNIVLISPLFEYRIEKSDLKLSLSRIMLQQDANGMVTHASISTGSTMNCDHVDFELTYTQNCTIGNVQQISIIAMINDLELNTGETQIKIATVLLESEEFDIWFELIAHNESITIIRQSNQVSRNKIIYSNSQNSYNDSTLKNALTNIRFYKEYDANDPIIAYLENGLVHDLDATSYNNSTWLNCNNASFDKATPQTCISINIVAVRTIIEQVNTLPLNGSTVDVGIINITDSTTQLYTIKLGFILSSDTTLNSINIAGHTITLIRARQPDAGYISCEALADIVNDIRVSNNNNSLQIDVGSGGQHIYCDPRNFRETTPQRCISVTYISPVTIIDRINRMKDGDDPITVAMIDIASAPHTIDFALVSDTAPGISQNNQEMHSKPIITCINDMKTNSQPIKIANVDIDGVANPCSVEFGFVDHHNSEAIYIHNGTITIKKRKKNQALSSEELAKLINNIGVYLNNNDVNVNAADDIQSQVKRIVCQATNFKKVTPIECTKIRFSIIEQINNIDSKTSPINIAQVKITHNHSTAIYYIKFMQDIHKDSVKIEGRDIIMRRQHNSNGEISISALAKWVNAIRIYYNSDLAINADYGPGPHLHCSPEGFRNHAPQRCIEMTLKTQPSIMSKITNFLVGNNPIIVANINIISTAYQIYLDFTDEKQFHAEINQLSRIITIVSNNSPSYYTAASNINEVIEHVGLYEDTQQKLHICHNLSNLTNSILLSCNNLAEIARINCSNIKSYDDANITPSCTTITEIPRYTSILNYINATKANNTIVNVAKVTINDSSDTYTIKFRLTYYDGIKDVRIHHDTHSIIVKVGRNTNYLLSDEALASYANNIRIYNNENGDISADHVSSGQHISCDQSIFNNPANSNLTLGSCDNISTHVLPLMVDQINIANMKSDPHYSLPLQFATISTKHSPLYQYNMYINTTHDGISTININHNAKKVTLNLLNDAITYSNSSIKLELLHIVYYKETSGGNFSLCYHNPSSAVADSVEQCKADNPHSQQCLNFHMLDYNTSGEIHDIDILHGATHCPWSIN